MTKKVKLNENATAEEMQKEFENVMKDLELTAEELDKVTGGAKGGNALQSLLDIHELEKLANLASTLKTANITALA